MRNIIIGWIIGAFLAGSLRGAADGDALLARIHFAGTASFAGNTNALTLQKILALPSTVAWKNFLLDQIAARPGQRLAEDGNHGPDHSFESIRPLLDDALTAETYLEWRNSGAFVWTARLPEDRARLWQTNLWKALAEVTGGQPGVLPDGSGWRYGAAGGFRLARTGAWLIVSSGPEATVNDLTQRIQKTGGPVASLGTNWLDAEIDWPRLEEKFPALRDLPLRAAHLYLTLSSKSDSIRTVLRAVYPQNLEWKSEAWHIPAKLIRDPLVSFTAVQNFGVLLREPESLTKLEVDPLRSQSFFWSQSLAPFQTFAAVRVKDGPRALQVLSAQLPASFNPYLSSKKAGLLKGESAPPRIAWTGLPLITPSIVATNEAAGNFLYFSLFPGIPTTNQVPRELTNEITGRKNLIYYDWEMSQLRLNNSRVMYDLLPFFPRPRGETLARPEMSRAYVLGQSWFDALTPLLGNTVTEVTLEKPNEIRLIRRSQIGLTGMEIVGLERLLINSGLISPTNSAAAHP